MISYIFIIMYSLLAGSFINLISYKDINCYVAFLWTKLFSSILYEKNKSEINYLTLSLFGLYPILYIYGLNIYIILGSITLLSADFINIYFIGDVYKSNSRFIYFVRNLLAPITLIFGFITQEPISLYNIIILAFIFTLSHLFYRDGGHMIPKSFLLKKDSDLRKAFLPLMILSHIAVDILNPIIKNNVGFSSDIKSWLFIKIMMIFIFLFSFEKATKIFKPKSIFISYILISFINVFSAISIVYFNIYSNLVYSTYLIFNEIGGLLSVVCFNILFDSYTLYFGASRAIRIVSLLTLTFYKILL